MSNISRSLSVAALVAASLLSTACGDHEVKVNGAKVEHASFAKRDTTTRARPG